MKHIDYLSSLPGDIFFQQLTYLPFDDVIKVCILNRKLRSYCLDLKYNVRWKAMIDNTFSSVYNYEDKLKKVWSKLNIVDNTYNYLVYTQLINLLDPLTQLMIYYQRGDTKLFNDKRFNDTQRFLTMFLLNKPLEMKKYYLYDDREHYFSLLKGEKILINDLNKMLTETEGNIRGIKYLIEQGANIHAYDDFVLREVCLYGYIDVVKYLVEQGADIHVQNNYPLKEASYKGHLDVVKYLVEQGANIHDENDIALILASEKGHLDVVKYLVEQGANIHGENDYALDRSSRNGHLDVIIYLVERGANIHAQNDLALMASKFGDLDVIKYLVEHGADIHAGRDQALIWASQYGHLDIVKYLVEQGADIHALHDNT